MSARYALALCESCEGSGETEAESHRMDCPDCLGTGYEEPQKRILNLQSEFSEMRYQRDTLAEAMREVRAICLDKTIETHPDEHTKGTIDDCIDIAESALEAVKGGIYE